VVKNVGSNYQLGTVIIKASLKVFETFKLNIFKFCLRTQFINQSILLTLSKYIFDFSKRYAEYDLMV